LPFAATSGSAWRRDVMSGSFSPLSEHFENPPERWQSFFSKSFAMDPAKRAHSAAEFFRNLEEAFT
jgi:hypothetical protein